MKRAKEKENMLRDGKFHVIPSVRNMRYLEQALKLEEEWILLTNCIHIGNLKETVQKCHRAGKKVIVNHEIVGGLGADKTAFQMLKKMYHVDCVMGSSNIRLSMLKREGLPVIQRAVLSDRFSVEQILESMKDSKADMLELRPAYYAVKFLGEFKQKKTCSYIAGGFIDTKEMADMVYEAGFAGLTTSCTQLWGYQPGR